MVAARYAYSKGRSLIRRVSAAFAVFIGFIAIFFSGTPKMWNSENSNKNVSSSSGFFTPDSAYADTLASGGTCDGDSDGG